jgi:S-adenosylmethionine synthetase
LQNLHIEARDTLDIRKQTFEIVERKGIGHPDTLADGIAEAVSQAYSRYCLKNFGYILHHNADKTLLLGGSSAVRFGGGEITSPITIQINGRFSHCLGDQRIPVIDILTDAARAYVQSVLRFVDIERDIYIKTNISTASSPGFVHTSATEGSRKYWFAPRDLSDLSEIAHLRSNDTSCGVGYAPLSPLETAVLTVERALNESAFQGEHPQFGTDIKVMGIRSRNQINLTVCVPQIDRFVDSVETYQANIELIKTKILNLIPAEYAGGEISVNVRDNFRIPELYMTVTGSSIESGDEGVVGRGNRANGLITPMRPMSIEGVCGKNPVYHIGKLYNALATSIAWRLHEEIGGTYAVFLVSQSGRDLFDPWFVGIQHTSQSTLDQQKAASIVRSVFDDLEHLRQAIVQGQTILY